MAARTVIMVALCAVVTSWAKDIPDYIDICKRDQSTIDDCVKRSIEKLRPKLVAGIPDLKVPPLEPFYIPELVVDQGNFVQFKAVGHDVKVTGAGNFTIKSIHVDLERLVIRARVKFPQLHFDGRYSLDARVLVLPLHGQGNIIADAYKCDAELVLHAVFVERGGVEYIKFDTLDMDINLKDYRVSVDGLFRGNDALGEQANMIINQNKAEFLKATKPIVEKTCAKLLLDSANKIAGTYPIDDLLPMP